MIGLLAGLLSSPALAAQPVVKLSSSGICHDQSSAWYGRTKSYTPYPSMTECLKHGRASKAYSAPASGAAGGQTSGHGSTQSYDRSLFHVWADEDHNCINTRHELLAKLSTRAPIFSADHCRVVRGRWNDPYTGLIFFNSRKMDIDHIVPLYWAWQHGADRWAPAKRESFANDFRNLVAVDASTNREKGAQGPLEWLPPNRSYQCQYILRFTRIIKLYGLQQSRAETDGFLRMRSKLCG